MSTKPLHALMTVTALVFGLALGGGAAKAQGLAPNDPAAPAQPPAPTVVAAPAPPLPRVALTISPLLLFLPIFELTGEVRLDQRVGVGLVAGYGKVTIDDPDVQGGKLTLDVVEAGAQFRYYVVGDFRHGMQLGAEALYLNVSGGAGTISAVADGLSLGPFVGYKFTSASGFTFDSQLGAARVGVAASAKNSATTQKANASDSKWTLLLNLNVGWSF